MKYCLEIYNDLFDRWDYFLSSNSLEVVVITFKEQKKLYKSNHYRIIEVLDRC